MFKARGTKALFGFGSSAEDDKPVAVHEPVVADMAPARLEPVVVEPDPALPPSADDYDLALAIGMTPTLPPLPHDFVDRVRAAQAGDLESISLMREIGDAVPPHMQMAFQEMVEDMLATG